MHFSLVSITGSTLPKTMELTGKTEEQLDTLPTQLEDGTVFGECYNEYEDEGECTQYYINHIHEGSVIIDQVDTESPEHYTHIIIDYPETGQIVGNPIHRTIYTNLLEVLDNYTCPQYEDMDEVRAILMLRNG